MSASPVNDNDIKITPVRRRTAQFYPPQLAIKHFKNDVRGTLGKIFFGLLIVPYYIVIGLAWGIFGIILFALTFGFICAMAALGSVITMVLGNHILRIAHLSHYTSDIWACRIGAIGGPIVAIASIVLNTILVPFGPLILVLCGPLWARILQILKPCISVAFGATTGAIGCHILIKHGVELPGSIDVLHAARAGALGAAILGPGVLIATTLIQWTFMGVLIAAMMLPLGSKIEDAARRTIKVIMECTTSVYSCLCVATRGGRDGDVIYSHEWV